MSASDGRHLQHVVGEVPSGPRFQTAFCLSAVDGPSIHLLVCRDKNRVIAEHALRDIQKPIGVSDYLSTRALPQELKASLPTIEQLEEELQDVEPEGTP